MSKYIGVTERNKDLPESYDEYIETIYRLSLNHEKNIVKNIEISKSLDVKPSSVSKMLAKLSEHGYIDWKPRGRGIKLLSKGKDRAIKIITSNKITELFLSHILNIKDQEEIEKISCQFEHYYSEHLTKGLIHLLGISNSEIQSFNSKLMKEILPQDESFNIKPIFSQEEVREILIKILKIKNKEEIDEYINSLLARDNLKK